MRSEGRALFRASIIFRAAVVFRVAIVLFVLSALGGCSLTGAVKGAFSNASVSQTYDLVLDHQRVRRAKRLGTQLVVTEPQALRALAGDNILVKPSPNVVTYYGGSIWGDRLPKLLQARFVEAMRVSGRFRAVSDGSDRIKGDVTLATTVEAFQVEVNGARAEAVVIIFAKLIHMESGKVYASKKFSHRVPAATREVAGGVEALNGAMNEMMASLTGWITRRAGY
ncbi:MAG: hypothetical protein DHS20C08_10520 [Rhodomicrobium sp.]|nr:MAG: hypothetical protein DHS20C08_10520 [Rhodomicrobium sp.]